MVDFKEALELKRINEKVKSLKKYSGKVSDGHHTFDELYNHRVTLYIALCSVIKNMGNRAIGEKVRRAELHSDGTRYDGQFVLGIGHRPGEQITYHIPIERRSECEFAETRTRAPKFDGHTSDDVINRLMTFIYY